MNYPAASSGVSSGNFYRPKGRGIEPSSAGGGLICPENSIYRQLILFDIHTQRFVGLAGDGEYNLNDLQTPAAFR